MNKAILKPAFVLHTRPYRDTSLLVELFTLEDGRLTVVARSARGMKSRFRGILSPFLPLLVSFSGRSELRTLQQVEPNGLTYDLKGDTLLSGFYLNELLMKLLPCYEPHHDVYNKYQDTLSALVQSSNQEVDLRLFEKCLLNELGYGLELDRTVTGEQVLSNEQYIFEYGSGLVKAKAEHYSNFLGKNLLALHDENLKSLEELRDAKRLLRSVLAILLGARPLKSREMFCVS